MLKLVGKKAPQLCSFIHEETFVAACHEILQSLPAIQFKLTHVHTFLYWLPTLISCRRYPTLGFRARPCFYPSSSNHQIYQSDLLILFIIGHFYQLNLHVLFMIQRFYCLVLFLEFFQIIIRNSKSEWKKCNKNYSKYDR
jgi:hypothetical protein